jgi:CobQ-like glutamine amidotransferase family enzyme
MLVVCGMFQLFGVTYIPADGHEIQGISVFDAVSTASAPRICGPITVQTRFGVVSGYENHSGVTRLAPQQPALGRVLSGVGNGAGLGVEGATFGPAVGTYLHGPVLAANPEVADHLLLAALHRHNPHAELAQLSAPGRSSRVRL